MKCVACGAGDHEKEDCTYRQESLALREMGFDVSAKALRLMEEAGNNVDG